MKKNLPNILGDLDAAELDVLLDGTHLEKLDPAITKRIQEKVCSKIDPPERKAAKTHVFKINRRRLTALAACFVLLIFVGLGSYACAVEVKEYNDAIRFFDDHDLSTEGLTRGEIKAVYRDITTNSFTYGKTAEVIEKTLSIDQIGGYDILQADPTPEDIQSLWNHMNSNTLNNWLENPDGGIRYEYRSEYMPYDESILDKSFLEKYDDDTLLWSVSFTEFGIDGYSVVSDGVIAFGDTQVRSITYAWMAKIDNNGNVIWKRALDNGFYDEYISEILENDDGSYAVFSRGDLEYFCLSQYTADGEMTHFQKTPVGNYGIWNAARFSDGYIVQLGSYVTSEHAKIVKVDTLGSITESFSYSGEDASYYITDMIEFDGSIYLSAYAVPIPSYDPSGDCDPSGGFRDELALVLDYLFDNDIWEISSEELTPVVRDNYTAMLLVCDPNEGIPQEFYSVKGSMGGRLSWSDAGKLLWEVESITTTFYSPATSAFSIGGASYVFQYTFDTDGALISQEDTGEVVTFMR